MYSSMSAFNTMKNIPLSILSIALFFQSCTEEIVDTPNANTVVVAAYLYAGEPVTNVKITSLIPFNADSTNEFYINDAEIDIIHDVTPYRLVLSDGDSGYYHYPGDDLQIINGETYELRMEYYGEVINAFTTVPEKPSGLEITAEEIFIEPIYEVFDLRNRDILDVDISWINDNGEYYYILVDNVESDPVNIDINGIFEGFLGGMNFTFITRPTQFDVYRLSGLTLQQYGRHRVKLYKINQEYADLYESTEQDSRDLNEPLNNINNGLGIFTSFNSDSLFFEVRMP
jgi:hypothetical protein